MRPRWFCQAPRPHASGPKKDERAAIHMGCRAYVRALLPEEKGRKRSPKKARAKGRKPSSPKPSTVKQKEKDDRALQPSAERGRAPPEQGACQPDNRAGRPPPDCWRPGNTCVFTVVHKTRTVELVVCVRHPCRGVALIPQSLQTERRTSDGSQRPPPKR
jgi:hypothetical protein